MEDAHGHGGHAELFKPIGCTLDHAFYFPTREQKSTQPAPKWGGQEKKPPVSRGTHNGVMKVRGYENNFNA